MISFKQIDNDLELSQIEAMAAVIWHEHYAPIIGRDQVEYMLIRFQSVVAMQQQIDQGYQYFRIDCDGLPVGYLSFEKRDAELFLSKLYLLKEFRGKGLGQKALKFVLRTASDQECKKVTLTVNKNNLKAIKSYENAGFLNVGPVVQDIGNGYVMDDYILEKEVK